MEGGEGNAGERASHIRTLAQSRMFAGDLKNNHRRLKKIGAEVDEFSKRKKGPTARNAIGGVPGKKKHKPI